MRGSELDRVILREVRELMDKVNQILNMFSTPTIPITQTPDMTFQEFPDPDPLPPIPMRNLIAPRFELGITYKLLGAEPTSEQRSIIWRQIDRVFQARYEVRLRVRRENRNETKAPKPNGKSGKWTRVDVAEELGMVNELYNVICEVLPMPPDYQMPVERRKQDEHTPESGEDHSVRTRPTKKNGDAVAPQ